MLPRHVRHHSRPLLGGIPGPVKIRRREQRNYPVTPLHRVAHCCDHVPARGPVPHGQLDGVPGLGQLPRHPLRPRPVRTGMADEEISPIPAHDISIVPSAASYALSVQRPPHVVPPVRRAPGGTAAARATAGTCSSGCRSANGFATRRYGTGRDFHGYRRHSSPRFPGHRDMPERTRRERRASYCIDRGWYLQLYLVLFLLPGRAPRRHLRKCPFPDGFVDRACWTRAANRMVAPSSSLLDCLGRVCPVKAKPLRGRFASLDTTATARGMAAIKEDGGGVGHGSAQVRPESSGY